MRPSFATTCLFLAAISSGQTADAPAPKSPFPLRDKTLVAWVEPANLTQRGGSVLTLETPGGAFDGIVFGELAPARWMAGSEMFHRTHRDQAAWPAETAGPGTLVQIAVVYQGQRVTLFRDGREYAAYAAGGAESFEAGSKVLMGLRHLEAAAANRFFTGSIDDARIYSGALSGAQLAALQPNRTGPAPEPVPVAWWHFENGSAMDQVGAFPTTALTGKARLAGGRLHLDTPGAYLLATRAASDGAGEVDARDPNSVARALREKLLSDPHRPGYHFVIPEGQAMPFDPNGAIYWKGRYHLFYIFQDRRGHNWGHVSSTDLFHWRHHPTGLTAGMFSGNCFVNRDGRPTMCYHQVGQGNAMAVALDDDLNTWKKLETNPITPSTAPGDAHHGKYRSWDPFGWVEGDTYYAIFGGEHPGVAKSPSLGGPWTYTGDLMANSVPGVSINEDVSCADFFRLGDRHVLICISHRLGARYYIGDWKNEQFHPTSHEKMSWVDNSFFAPETLLDHRGRRILWAWIFDRPGFKMRTKFGWSGTLSLPRVLALGPDGTLRQSVPEEIERLRQNPRQQAGLRVLQGRELTLEGIAGNSLELSVEFRPGAAGKTGIKVLCSPGGEEQTLVYYDATTKSLGIDTTRGSLTEDPRSVESGPLTLAPDEPLRLRVFVDRSVVEVFANDRQAVMRRVYPSRADSLQVRLFADGAALEAATVQAWDIAPSNPF